MRQQLAAGEKVSHEGGKKKFVFLESLSLSPHAEKRRDKKMYNFLDEESQ